MVNVEAKVIRTQKKFNFNAKEFITQALGIIKRDIEQGIVDRRQIDGSAMPTLEPITIKMKTESQGMGRIRKKTQSEQRGVSNLKQRRSGIAVDPSHPLIDTGNLLKNQVIEVGETEGTMRIGTTRAEIGKKLQIDGVGKKGKRFIFFGISKTAQDQIHTLLAKRWKESFEITRAK
jgi:hypothetical protein